LSAQISLAKEYRKKALVVSHERSGTHFLMNTLGLNFGYISHPWWNFDLNLGINFFEPNVIGTYFRQFHDRPVLNILKSHHLVSVFQDHMDYLAEQFHIFYIYRDPRDLMVSYWKMVQDFPYAEGPKTKSVSDFIRAEPCGAMLRYQYQQERNVLRRWHTHVRGWLDFCYKNQQYPVHFVRYEKLNRQFESEIEKIATFTGIQPLAIDRPAVNKNVVGEGRGKVGDHSYHLVDEDLQFISNEIGDLMEELEYV